MTEPGHIHALIKKRLHSNVVLESTLQFELEKLLIRKQDLLSVVYFLQNDPDVWMDLLVDVTCVEHDPGTSSISWNISVEDKRFEIVYTFCSTKFEYRAQLSLLLGAQDPAVDTLTGLYQGADWLERELWDMFGIEVEDHPQMQRLLTYQGFAGHPMRKKYPLEKSQPLIPYHKGQAHGPKAKHN